jgi:hypothetical protein
MVSMRDASHTTSAAAAFRAFSLFNKLCVRRFSSPILRAWSIRFSKSLFMHVANDQLMLSLRVGNVRSKTILNPSTKMVLAMEIDDSGQEDGKPLCLVVRPMLRSQ